MPIFDYKGFDKSGKAKKGLLESESERTLREHLRKDGIFVTSIRDGDGQTYSKKGAKKLGLFSREFKLLKLFQRISVEDISVMTRQLSTLLGAGVPMVDSLVALIEQVENEKLKNIISQVKADVNEGEALAKAMGKHKCFTNIYINMIRAGESSGSLEVVLARLADFTESQSQLKSKVLGAMLYPVIMVCVGAGILAIMFTTVIPKITQIFNHSKVELPFLTRMLIGSSSFMQNYWWLLLAIVLLSAFLLYKWKKTETGRYKWDKLKLSVPIFGSILRMLAVARLTRTLATLLSSGVSLLISLDIVRNILSNTVLEAAIDDVKDAVREGEDIATPLRRSGEFPPIVTQMIAIGEKTGELESMLDRVATNYEYQVQTRIGMLTSLLEPIMILAMGASVAIIVFAILTPIMQMSQVVR